MIPGIQVAILLGGVLTVIIGAFVADYLHHIHKQLKRMNDLEEKAQRPFIEAVKTPDRISKESLEDFQRKWNQTYGQYPLPLKYEGNRTMTSTENISNTNVS